MHCPWSDKNVQARRRGDAASEIETGSAALDRRDRVPRPVPGSAHSRLADLFPHLTQLRPREKCRRLLHSSTWWLIEKSCSRLRFKGVAMVTLLTPRLLVVMAYLRLPRHSMDGYIFSQRVQATRRIWSDAVVVSSDWKLRGSSSE